MRRWMMILIALCGFAAVAAVMETRAQQPPPLASIATHDAFFDLIRGHCGKAYGGKVVADIPEGDGFKGELVMHVRKCTDTRLEIPFHVGEDRSRTWIITKTGSGLSLKHDHRKKDASHDPVTMYGGHTLDAGWNNAQSFPADQYSKELFVKTGIPQSVSNTWNVFIYPDTFTYLLSREGRKFRVDFDLKRPIPAPPAPWGYR